MVILEAIVAGLPVLATATCGYAFHVEKAGAGNIIPEPFSQQGMDAMLLAMLTGIDRPRWRDNGIHYGREGDFYAMPDRVAEIIMASGTRRGHGN
jgi:UDP-glucose:(heptosyl)LPS alpha-1,3-glucosyltransferase